MAFPAALSPAETCIISGRVIDESGVPVPSAAVSALRPAVVGNDLLVSGAAASPGGEYCIRELPPGKYIVRAVARTQPPSASPQCASCCGSSLTEFQTTFYPASLLIEHAALIEITEGKSAAGIDIMMRRVRPYCVRGRGARRKRRPYDGSCGCRGGGFVVPPEYSPKVADFF
ncbi:MAG: carboxypeptidase-like regulatory domain-containing protein [Rhodospirillales bacterium]